ncbi:MAG: response regulator [Limisphaerales bacterium]
MDSAIQADEAVAPMPRLLVVDDEPDNLELLCRLFQRHGCEVFPAVNGTDALRLASELKPDLLVLDVMLPDLNGREVCRRIKADPALTGVFVALISSIEVSPDSKVAGLECGADDYITRPIANRELVARVDALIRIQRALSARQQAEERLAQLNLTLEQRVTARTAELAASNEQLRREVAECQQAQARSEAFARLGERLSTATTPRAAAEVILETARQLLGWDACFLQLYSAATDRLTPVLAFDTRAETDAEVTDTFRLLRPSPLMRRIMRRGAQLVLRQPGSRPARTYRPFGDECRVCASLLFVPLRHGGAVTGVLSVQSYTPGHYSAESLRTLQALAEHCGGALERLRAEAARRASDERFAAFMEHAPVFAWIKDERFRYVYLNPRARRFLRLPPDNAQSQTDFDLFPRAHARRIRSHDQAALQHGTSSEVMEDFTESLKDPRHVWVLRFPLKDAEGRQFLAGMAVDVSEKVRAEEALRTLPHRIIEAQESERRRVARELHDGVSQLLASVRFRLLAVEGWLHDRADDTLRREVTRAKSYLASALREVRAISHNLRPRELDDLGLVAAIQSAAADLEEHSSLRVQCQLAGLRDRLPPEVELAFYRIYQVAVSNILKHAGAKRIEVQLMREHGGVTLLIADDGRGFTAARRSQRSARSSLGLVNMRERAEFIGGTLTIKSVPREGTTITVWVPGLKKSLKGKPA